MNIKLPHALLLVLVFALGAFYLSRPVAQQAGDIAEYFGITESLLNHGGVHLTPGDQHRLEQTLHPAYFHNPGYYVMGRNNNRYPVHFIAYSILATPIRAIIDYTPISPLHALTLTNLAIIAFGLLYIFWRFRLTSTQQILLMSCFFLSPLLFFIPWPGPDIFFITVLLISLFYFRDGLYTKAALLSAIASWHSQPILILAFCFAGMAFLDVHTRIMKTLSNLLYTVLALVLPYIYNLFAFGALTPWTILQDGWTIMRGFGIHNMSVWKLYEQFFDLNTGLFWYMPILMIFGILSLVFQSHANRKNRWLFIFFLLTCFFYQTNPGWHYGTAGYGPSRHIIFFIPLILFAITTIQNRKKAHTLLLTVGLTTQLLVLQMNNSLLPNFEHTLRHNALATFVLNTYPNLYTPTPEIFTDRTNHDDVPYPTSAIYTYNGTCKKAYILFTDIQKLTDACGYIPEKYAIQLDDPFTRKGNYTRSVWVLQARLIPERASCLEGYTGEFMCIKTDSEIRNILPNTEVSRIQPIREMEGGWIVTKGNPVNIIVPPGYILEYSALEGMYITYD